MFHTIIQSVNVSLSHHIESSNIIAVHWLLFQKIELAAVNSGYREYMKVIRKNDYVYWKVNQENC